MQEGPEFQTIGELAAKAKVSQVKKVSALDKSSSLPNNSLTTGNLFREQRGSSEIGKRLGVSGAGTILNLTAIQSAELASADPKVVDRSLSASLPSRVKLSMKARWRDKVGRHGFDTEFLGYDLTEKIKQEDVDEALVLLHNVCAPCPPDIAVKAATALRLRTKARREHVDDLKMMVALFAEDLSQYPADVVNEGG